MADIHIRIKGIDADVKARLEQAAAEHGMSLNKYICNILTDYAMNPSIRIAEDKYTNLAKDMIGLYEQTLNRAIEALNENSYVMKKMMAIESEE